jgi:hypothetical protein
LFGARPATAYNQRPFATGSPALARSGTWDPVDKANQVPRPGIA